MAVILLALKWAGCLKPGQLHEYQVLFLPQRASLCHHQWSPLQGTLVLSSRQDARRSSCSSGVAGTGCGEAPATAGWPDKHWQSLAESAAVLLLVDLLLQCCLDASVVVTDASMLEVRMFLLVLLGGSRTNGRWSCHGER
jgi:hypothetical protein